MLEEWIGKILDLLKSTKGINAISFLFFFSSSILLLSFYPSSFLLFLLFLRFYFFFFPFFSFLFGPWSHMRLRRAEEGAYELRI